MTTRFFSLRRLGLPVLAAALFLALGCSRPPVMVTRYILDYPSPEFRGLTTLPTTLKVKQFGVDQVFNSTAMVYRPGALKSAAYQYHEWRVNPGYLVTDYLARDFRNCRLFKAVFPSESLERSRFILEGGVAEIQEIDEPPPWKAALGLNITLLDTVAKEVHEEVVLQKSYRLEEPMAEQTPQSLVQGVNTAMAKLSEQIMADVYRAAKGRLEQKGEGPTK